MASLIDPPLTTVHINGRQMGVASSELLLKSVENAEDSAGIILDVGYGIIRRKSA